MAIAFTVAFTATPLAAGVKALVYATRPLSAGINRPSKKEFVQVSVMGSAQVSPFNFLADYTARFGSLVAGTKIFVRVVPIAASGLLGPAIESSVLVS